MTWNMPSLPSDLLTDDIDGAGATTYPVQGIGSVDVSTGYSVGVIAITGGTGLSASLLEF